MKLARIMIAENPQVLQVTEKALSDFELLTVANIQQAEHQVMEEGIDLFVLGIHFDDSRAMELVSFIRNDAKYKETPIIILRLLPTSIAKSLRTTINALIKIGSVSLYLEIEGHPDPIEKIRHAVNSFLPGEKMHYLKQDGAFTAGR